MTVIAYMIGDHRVLIDEEYLPLMQSQRFYINGAGYITHKADGGRGNTRYLHRTILGAKDGDVVDHINGDKRDNRLVNLRICSHQENMRNGPLRKDNTSGFKGVSLCKKSLARPWVAQLTLGKNHHIGKFASKIEAAIAYDEEAKKHYGKFARLNFPEKIQEEIIISATHYHVDYKTLTTSKYRGVSFNKRNKSLPWAACTNKDRKTIHLKNHATQEDAARAHDKKSWELFKDSSRLNFPEEYLNDDGF